MGKWQQGTTRIFKALITSISLFKMKKIKLNKELFIGAFLIGLAFFYFGSNLFTSQSALVQREGELNKAEVTYREVDYRGQKSIKCELTISLKRDQSEYSIFKNIDQKTHYAKFEEIKRKLNSSKRATIWIKQSEATNNKPKVFQISYQRGKLLYDIDDAKSHPKFGFILFCSFGMIFIFFALKKR